MKAIDIPVVSAPSTPPGLTGNASILLHEIADRVRRLIEMGETSAIDLLAMPLTAADLEWLRKQLGEGEIRIALEADGQSSIHETQCPAVWWVTHHNAGGGVLSAFIEVTTVPEIVKAPMEDVRCGLNRLEELIAATRSGTPFAIEHKQEEPNHA